MGIAFVTFGTSRAFLQGMARNKDILNGNEVKVDILTNFLVR